MNVHPTESSRSETNFSPDSLKQPKPLKRINNSFIHSFIHSFMQLMSSTSKPQWLDVIIMLRHVRTSFHNYIFNFVDWLFPLASEEHCGYTSLNEHVITIQLLLLGWVQVEDAPKPKVCAHPFNQS